MCRNFRCSVLERPEKVALEQRPEASCVAVFSRQRKRNLPRPLALLVTRGPSQNSDGVGEEAEW